jgi:hypothetical protein
MTSDSSRGVWQQNEYKKFIPQEIFSRHAMIILSWFSHCICLLLRESGNEWFSKSHKKKKSRKKLFCQAIVRCEFYSRLFFLSTVWSGKNVEEFFCIEIYNPIHHTRPWAFFTFLNIFFVYFLLLLQAKKGFYWRKIRRKLRVQTSTAMQLTLA